MATELPRRAAPPGGVRHRIARWVLALGGWAIEGAPPELPRYVIVAAPHTFWWDSVWMLAFAWFWGVRVRWIIKSSLARGPAGWFLSRLGAVPVDRSTPQGQVASLVRAMRERAEIVIAIAPEGTRARRDHWRSGFYHLAREAEVPLCLSYLDYGKHRGGFGPCFVPTGDVKADMDLIRTFYADKRARHPDRFTPPRLREEELEPR